MIVIASTATFGEHVPGQEGSGTASVEAVLQLIAFGLLLLMRCLC